MKPSLVIATKNRKDDLRRAIISAAHQTESLEIIVVDDGSSDDPASVCSKYTGVKYFRVERVGVSAARNIGVRLSKGNFLVFLDADDFLYSDGIQHNLSYFAWNKMLVLVSGAHDRVDSSGNLLPGDQASEKKENNYSRRYI